MSFMSEVPLQADAPHARAARFHDQRSQPVSLKVGTQQIVSGPKTAQLSLKSGERGGGGGCSINAGNLSIEIKATDKSCKVLRPPSNLSNPEGGATVAAQWLHGVPHR